MKKTKTVIFTVSGRDFNAIMSVCSPATSRDGSRETLERIEVRLDNGQGIATAMDGYVMEGHRRCRGSRTAPKGATADPKPATKRSAGAGRRTQYRFEYRQTKPLRGAWLLPRFRQMRADSEVTLTITPKMVSADDGMTVVAAYVDQNPYVNWPKIVEDRVAKETVHRVFFQKSVLIKALKCVKGNETLMLEMAGSKYAVMLRSPSMSGLIMPMVCHTDPEKQFCHLVCGLSETELLEKKGKQNGNSDGQNSAGGA